MTFSYTLPNEYANDLRLGQWYQSAQESRLLIYEMVPDISVDRYDDWDGNDMSLPAWLRKGTPANFSNCLNFFLTFPVDS